MLTIAYDHQIFAIQRYGGISRYFRMMIEQIALLEGVEPHVIAPEYHEEAVCSLPGTCTRHCGRPVDPLVGVEERLSASLKDVRQTLGIMKPDVVHETYFTRETPTWDKSPTVITVHDMNHEKYPELCHPGDRTALFKKAALQWADHVVCVSESTRRDLLEYTNIDADKVSVVHHGVAPLTPDPVRQDSPHERPYLLFVGHRGGYKNFTGLVAAMAVASKDVRECDLICIGGGPLSREEFDFIVSAGLDPQRVVHRDCNDCELADYYAYAEGFIFPSLSEGFGMPLLEAMHYGCPVMCADAGSLPEVAGDSAEYFVADSPDSMARAMDTVVGSAEARERLIRSGHARAQAFTWESCARNTLEVYRSLL